MITADEARKRVELGTKNLSRLLLNIGEKIEEAADLERRFILLDEALPYHREFKIENHQRYAVPTLTPLQHRIKLDLERQGFQVKVEMVDTKIGGGLGSLDEEPRMEPIPHIKVSW